MLLTKKIFFLCLLPLIVTCHNRNNLKVTENINNVHDLYYQQKNIIKKQKDLTFKQDRTFFNDQCQLLLNEINEEQKKITELSIITKEKKTLLTNYQLLKTLIEKQKKVNHNHHYHFGYYLLLSFLIINLLIIIFIGYFYHQTLFQFKKELNNFYQEKNFSIYQAKLFNWQRKQEDFVFNLKKLIKNKFYFDEYGQRNIMIENNDYVKLYFNKCFSELKNTLINIDFFNYFFLQNQCQKIVLCCKNFFLLYHEFFSSLNDKMFETNDANYDIFNVRFSLSIFNNTILTLEKENNYQEIISSFIYNGIMEYHNFNTKDRNCLIINDKQEDAIKQKLIDVINLDCQKNPNDNIVTRILHLIIFLDDNNVNIDFEKNAYFFFIKKIIAFNEKMNQLVEKTIKTNIIMSPAIKAKQLTFLLPRCFIQMINNFYYFIYKNCTINKLIKKYCLDFLQKVIKSDENKEEKEQKYIIVKRFLQKTINCFFNDYLTIISQRLMNHENYQVEIINDKYQLKIKKLKNNNDINNDIIFNDNNVLNDNDKIIKQINDIFNDFKQYLNITDDIKNQIINEINDILTKINYICQEKINANLDAFNKKNWHFINDDKVRNFFYQLYQQDEKIATLCQFNYPFKINIYFIMMIMLTYFFYYFLTFNNYDSFVNYLKVIIYHLDLVTINNNSFVHGISNNQFCQKENNHYQTVYLHLDEDIVFMQKQEIYYHLPLFNKGKSFFITFISLIIDISTFVFSLYYLHQLLFLKFFLFSFLIIKSYQLFLAFKHLKIHDYFLYFGRYLYNKTLAFLTLQKYLL